MKKDVRNILFAILAFSLFYRTISDFGEELTEVAIFLFSAILTIIGGVLYVKLGISGWFDKLDKKFPLWGEKEDST